MTLKAIFSVVLIYIIFMMSKSMVDPNLHTSYDGCGENDGWWERREVRTKVIYMMRMSILCTIQHIMSGTSLA